MSAVYRRCCQIGSLKWLHHLGLNRFATVGEQLILQELVTHSINELPLLPLGVCLRCCGPCCWRQVRRNDLLWLAEPALSADSGAALFDGDKATVSTAAATVDSTPFIRISRGRTDRNQHRCGSHNNRRQYADAAHPLGSLRARNERPAGCRAVKKGDELASSHCLPHRGSGQGIVPV